MKKTTEKSSVSAKRRRAAAVHNQSERVLSLIHIFKILVLSGCYVAYTIFLHCICSNRNEEIRLTNG